MSTSTPPKYSNFISNSPNVLTQVVRPMHKRRNAPPPIPVPVNPVQHDFKVARPVPTTRTMVAVELSNYPPSITHQDVSRLFKDFVIAPDFHMASAMRFAYPLRTFVWVNGRDAAERAVEELDGKVMGSRQIRVALVAQTSHEQKEVIITELADGLKIAIMDIAYAYYPHLAQKTLEVRELVEGATHYAFLQAREPITSDGAHGRILSQAADTVKWELIAGSCADHRDSQGQGKNGRLDALKSLQEIAEAQGKLHDVWGQWDNSCVLELDV